MRRRPTSSCASCSPTCRYLTRVPVARPIPDRKSTRLNSSHVRISYAVFCLKKKNTGIKSDIPRFPAPNSDLPLPTLASPPLHPDGQDLLHGTAQPCTFVVAAHLLASSIIVV